MLMLQTVKLRDDYLHTTNQSNLHEGNDLHVEYMGVAVHMAIAVN